MQPARSCALLHSLIASFFIHLSCRPARPVLAHRSKVERQPSSTQLHSWNAAISAKLPVYEKEIPQQFSKTITNAALLYAPLLLQQCCCNFCCLNFKAGDRLAACLLEGGAPLSLLLGPQLYYHLLHAQSKPPSPPASPVAHPVNLPSKVRLPCCFGQVEEAPWSRSSWGQIWSLSGFSSLQPPGGLAGASGGLWEATSTFRPSAFKSLWGHRLPAGLEIKRTAFARQLLGNNVMRWPGGE